MWFDNTIIEADTTEDQSGQAHDKVSSLLVYERRLVSKHVDIDFLIVSVFCSKISFIEQ